MKRRAIISTLASSELAARLQRSVAGEAELRERYRSFVEAEGFTAEDRRLALDLDGDETGDFGRHFLLFCLLLLVIAMGLALGAILGAPASEPTFPAALAETVRLS